MKTIVEINSTNYASHGNIAINIAKKAREEGFIVHTMFPVKRMTKKRYKSDQTLFGFWFERIVSERIAIFTGVNDSLNIFSTYDLIHKIKKVHPDLIHLHVMHNNFINISIFFNYLRKLNIPIVWTFHDCWAMTGHCPYLEMVGCNKWISGCNSCPQFKTEPTSLFFDTSKRTWNKKKELFSSIENLTIITCSNWLRKFTKKSFFKNKTIKVINNGIDLKIFKPTVSSFKKEYGIENKFLVLGVANYWGARKGLDTFIELSKMLPDNFQIIMVGTNSEVDKQLPENIISIHITYSQEELAKIYSAADVFVNPTREDNFPTVNIEALACGTPVITYRSGGSPEIIDDSCGRVVDVNDITGLAKEIINVCEKKPFSKNDCLIRAKNFDMNTKFLEYVDLYKELA